MTRRQAVLPTLSRPLPPAHCLSRRRALRNLTIWAAASPLLRAQQDILSGPDRVPGMDDLVNTFEFEPVARAKITKAAYDYIAGGVDSEWTLHRNRDAFQRITLRPRFLRGVSKLDLAIELFGSKIEAPILVAPTGSHILAHADAEAATARGAGAARTIMAVSSAATLPIEKIAEAATGPLWFQLYAGPDLDGTRERVERAVAVGCKTVCWTVDSPYGPHRERLLRDRSTATPSSSAPVTRQSTPRAPQPSGSRRSAPVLPQQYRLTPGFQATLTWAFLDQLQSWAKVPVLIKGVMTPEDALLAVKYGAAGVIVSNHGARRLDDVPSTIEVLPDIVDAVGGKLPVLIDGGFRRGTDVLKALAIGAKAVMVGRPPLWGLGGYGAAGVQRVLELLQTELARAMGLAGCSNLASINRSLVRISP